MEKKNVYGFIKYTKAFIQKYQLILRNFFRFDRFYDSALTNLSNTKKTFGFTWEVV